MSMMAPFDIENFSEGIKAEAKKAGGRDGLGKLPEDVWESYSAFANTVGGVIMLGVAEDDGRFYITGIVNVEGVLGDLWEGLKNPEKVSVNLLTEEDIEVRPYFGGRKHVIAIKVPVAPDSDRPVFINGSLLSGTYRREDSGDFLCNEEEIKEMGSAYSLSSKESEPTQAEE